MFSEQPYPSYAAQLAHGIQISQGLSSSVASHLRTAIQPRYLDTQNVQRFSEPSTNVISVSPNGTFIYFTDYFEQGGETSRIRRPQRELRITFPPTPEIPSSVPRPTPPTSSTVAIPSASNAGSPSEPGRPSALPPALPHPAVLLAEMSKAEIKKVQLRVRSDIYQFMITEDAMPVDEERDKKIARAISTAIQSVVGNTAVVRPPSLTKHTIGAMAAMRRAFKQYAFCHIHKEFGLRLELGSDGSEIQHRATRVRHLLTDFNFLRDPHHPETEFFSSSFFHAFMIDILFLTPMTLWDCVPSNNQLDNVFGLGSAALAATLKDFIQGYYCELSDCSADKWRDDYLSTLNLISCMRANPVRRDWLAMLQQSLMARGRAGLPPSHTFV